MTPSDAIADEALNQTVLTNLRRLEAASGRAILPQLLASFSAVTPPRLAALRAAIVAGNTQTVHHTAHALKGSSASLGAQHMARLCADLELLGQTSDLSHATGLLTSIELEFVRARAALEREMINR